MDIILLTLALFISTGLSLWRPVLQIWNAVLNVWDGIDAYQIFWSLITAALWVLYSTIHLHNLAVLLLKVITVVVMSCCFGVVFIYYPPQRKEFLSEFIIILSTVLPFVTVGMSLFYGVEGVGMIASGMNCGLCYWKYLNMKQAYRHTLESFSWLHSCIYEFNSLLWSTYAWEKDDFLLMVPNLILSVAGIVEMAAVLRYTKDLAEKKPLLSGE